MPTVHDELVAALELIGGPYHLGSKTPGPHTPSDCSGYISGICSKIHVPMAGGSIAQQNYCAQKKTYVGGAAGVAKFRKIPGALLFRRAGTGGDAIGHVVVVANGDKTLEYRGTAYGSGSWPIGNRPFTGGAYIPGVDYSILPPPTPAPAPTPFVPLSRPNLICGMNGLAVTVAFTELMTVSGVNLAANRDAGVFDVNCLTPVCDFQKFLGHQVTGQIDQLTWASLDFLMVTRGLQPIAI